MNHARLEDMVKGWFVGAFEPAAFHSDAAEVGIKQYKAGDTEEAHYHKVATEITAIISGKVEMCGKVFGAGDIIVLAPGDITSFKALEDTVSVVVKTPGALNDKYLVAE